VVNYYYFTNRFDRPFDGAIYKQNAMHVSWKNAKKYWFNKDLLGVRITLPCPDNAS